MVEKEPKVAQLVRRTATLLTISHLGGEITSACFKNRQLIFFYTIALISRSSLRLFHCIFCVMTCSFFIYAISLFVFKVHHRFWNVCLL